MLGQDDQPLIDFANAGQLGNVGVVNPHLDAGRLLQAIEDVQPPAAAVAA